MFLHVYGNKREKLAGHIILWDDYQEWIRGGAVMFGPFFLNFLDPPLTAATV